MPAVERFSYWSPLPDGRGHHEKAGRCQHFFSSWPLPTNGRRHSALPSSFFLERFSSLAESPCFHSHSSGLRQAECRLSSVRRARLTFSRISEALAVQMKGLGL